MVIFAPIQSDVHAVFFSRNNSPIRKYAHGSRTFFVFFYLYTGGSYERVEPVVVRTKKQNDENPTPGNDLIEEN